MSPSDSDLDYTLLALSIAAPHLAPKVLQMGVCFLEEGIDTAATDGRTIYINRSFWEELEEADRIFVLAHETLHALLGHVERMKMVGGDRIYNVAADIIVNEILSDKLRLATKLEREMATRENLGVPPELMSSEEIYWYLRQAYPPKIREVLVFEDYYEGGGGRLVRKPGRSFGTSSWGISGLREIEEAESRVSWRTLLRRKLREAMSRAYQTWTVPNRRFGLEAPGYREALRGGVVIATVDVSASIHRSLLSKFIAEVRAIADIAGVRGWGIAWDHVVEEVEPLRKFRVRRVFRGGGGTMFLPVLREVWKLSRGRRALVVTLTDGFWSDYEESLSIMRRMRGLEWIFVTSGSRIEGFETVVIE